MFSRSEWNAARKVEKNFGGAWSCLARVKGSRDARWSVAGRTGAREKTFWRVYGPDWLEQLQDEAREGEELKMLGVV